MITWSLIVVVAAGAFGAKLLGVLLASSMQPDQDNAWLGRLTALIPAALLTALVVTQTFGDGRTLTLDARAAGVAVGGLAAWARAPFVVVVVVAAATTAAVRAVGG